MKRKLKYAGIIWLLLCLPSIFGLRGCGTSVLYDEKIRHLAYGPSPVEFTKGYSNGAKILLEYHAASDDFHDYSKKMIWHAVGEIRGVSGEKSTTAAAWKATNATSNHENTIAWEIFKTSLDTSEIKETQTILIEKTYEEGEGQRISQRERIEKAVSNKIPVLQYGHSRHLTLIAKSPSDKDKMLIFNLSTHNIAEVVVSPWKYVKLVVFWPFSVIVDYITYPILWILPKPFIDG